MIHDIARSAVIRKTQKNVNIITGNYEAAFAIGLMSKICQVTLDASGRDILSMKDQLFQAIGGYEGKNEREKVLLRMLRDYKPSSVWDDDVEAMFQRGLAEKEDILETESFFH